MSVRDWIHEIADEEGVDLMLLEPKCFDAAIAGVASGFGVDPVIVYDTDKIIEVLMKDSEMAEDEAYEYFNFNIIGAYMGKGTPVYLQRYKGEEE